MAPTAAALRQKATPPSGMRSLRARNPSRGLCSRKASSWRSSGSIIMPMVAASQEEEEEEEEEGEEVQALGTIRCVCCGCSLTVTATALFTVRRWML